MATSQRLTKLKQGWHKELASRLRAGCGSCFVMVAHWSSRYGYPSAGHQAH